MAKKKSAEASRLPMHRGRRSARRAPRPRSHTHHTSLRQLCRAQPLQRRVLARLERVERPPCRRALPSGCMRLERSSRNAASHREHTRRLRCSESPPYHTVDAIYFDLTY